MKYSYEPTTKVSDDAIRALQNRIESGKVYGEISLPDVDDSADSVKRYATIDTTNVAIELLDIRQEDGRITIIYVDTGLCVSGLHPYKLALRGFAINDVIVNIITFDVVVGCNV